MPRYDQHREDVQADAAANAWMKEHGHEWGEGVVSAARLTRESHHALLFNDAPEPEPSVQLARRNGRPKTTSVQLPREFVRELLRDGPRTKADICATLEMSDYTFRQVAADLSLQQVRSGFQAPVMYKLP